MDTKILTHFEQKKAWMASHITQAQYPTQMSLRGLANYQSQESIPEIYTPTTPSPQNSQTFYVVDSHPLMVRYAKTMASYWKTEEQDAILEFISQLSLTDMPLPKGMQVELYLGMQQGTPASIAMLIQTQNQADQTVISGCYDIFAKNEMLKDEILHYIAQQHLNHLFVIENKFKPENISK